MDIAQDRLLPLPGFFLGRREGSAADGLRATGHFLRTWAAPAFGKDGPPDARERLAALFSRDEGGPDRAPPGAVPGPDADGPPDESGDESPDKPGDDLGDGAPE